jgi:DNA mismatch endonuclease (patch repair protein)
MVDVLTPEQRRLNMSRNRGSNTAPELAVRKLLRELGCTGYHLHLTDLPGRPDIVLRRCRRVIFVHGCFWHRHSCVYGQATPKTNTRFWKEKFERNMMRDRQSKRSLHALGWSFTTIWECQLRHPGKVRSRLVHAIRQRVRRPVQP